MSRALAIDSLLNRLISLSFARQLHAHFLPSTSTAAVDKAVTELGVEIRRDTVARLRHVLELVSTSSLRDAKAIQRHAIDQGLAIGAYDMPLRAKIESLWDHLHARGRLFMERSGRAPTRGRAGFEIAAGS